ncbi:MAG: T9SS type A sorting domain-containing protein, partial [Ginsengibacter sp.]
ISIYVLKRIFYIFLLIAGFHFSSTAQVKSTFINNDAVKAVKFYPNPAASFINFEFNRDYDKSYTLVIYNFIGKKMTELKPTEQKISVPLTDYYRGVYIFQLRDGQGNVVESGKFQVIK